MSRAKPRRWPSSPRLPCQMTMLGLCLLFAPGLRPAAAQNQNSKFIDVGAPWNTGDGDATCIQRKSKELQTTSKGLQDLKQGDPMVDCEEHGALRGFWMRAQSNDFFWYEFICCKPRSTASVWATSDFSKLRQQYYETKGSYAGNYRWYGHNYVLVGWDHSDSQNGLLDARCTNPEISGMKSWKYYENDQRFWQWQGNCIEMELLMPPTWHANGYKSAGSNGNSANRHPCSTAGQCNEVYYLDRQNITCPGESSVITSFSVHDPDWYERTSYDGRSQYEMEYRWECAKIGKSYPRRSGRYVFVRQSSTDGCLTTFLGQGVLPSDVENRVYFQAQCNRTDQELFYAQILQSTPDYDRVKLVHAKTGKCLNREDGSASSDANLSNCDDVGADKQAVRASGTLMDNYGYYLSTPVNPMPANPANVNNKVKWENVQSLARSRWVAEVTEGESINNFGDICSPATLNYLSWRQADDQGKLKCPFQETIGVGRAQGPLQLAVPKPFENILPLKYIEVVVGKGRPSDGLVGVAASFGQNVTVQEIIAPDATGETVSQRCYLPDPGYMDKLWILTNRVLGIKIDKSDGTTCTLPGPNLAADLPWDEATEVAVESGVPVGLIGRASDYINALGVVFLGTLDTISFFPEFDQKAWFTNFLSGKQPIVYSGGTLTNGGKRDATFSRQVSYTVAETTSLTDASSMTTTKTYTWADSIAAKIGWSKKYTIKRPAIKAGRPERTHEWAFSMEGTYTHTWGGSSAESKGETLTSTTTNTTTTSVVSTCTATVSPKKSVSVELILFEAKQKLRYTGVVYYTLKSGANFSYPIEGDMGDVSQTNAICQIGPEVPIPPMTRAAGGMAANGTAAAAAVAPEYRYAVPTNTFINGSPCGKQYLLTAKENGMGVLEFARKCKVSAFCLWRRNRALFNLNAGFVEWPLLDLPRFSKQVAGKTIIIGC